MFPHLKENDLNKSSAQRDVEPALLSVVCDELNQVRIARGQERITTDLLTEEREGIIKSFYERAFEGINSKVRSWVENKLLTASGYRDRAALEDAIKLGLPESDFDRLVNCRILHREEREGIVKLELTHDLLTDPALENRTLREQHIQAEEAKKREAQYKKELKRTRRIAFIFSILLLVAAGLS